MSAEPDANINVTRLSAEIVEIDQCVSIFFLSHTYAYYWVSIQISGNEVFGVLLDAAEYDLDSNSAAKISQHKLDINAPTTIQVYGRTSSGGNNLGSISVSYLPAPAFHFTVVDGGEQLDLIFTEQLDSRYILDIYTQSGGVPSWYSGVVVLNNNTTTPTSHIITSTNSRTLYEGWNVNLYMTDVNNNPLSFARIKFIQPVTSSAVCFLGDAPVLTSRGYRPIREFAVGDSVMTADGREVAISRVFRKAYSPSAAANPYVIPKGSFGATRSVAISPNHEVMVAGRGMVKARDLGLKRMKMVEEFTYYNLELEDWVRDNLVIAGVTCESLAPANRITMTKTEFARFVTARYGPEAAKRLSTVCFEGADGRVSMPALR